MRDVPYRGDTGVKGEDRIFQRVRRADHMVRHMRLHRYDLPQSRPFLRRVEDKPRALRQFAAMRGGHPHHPVEDETEAGYVAAAPFQFIVDKLDIFRGLIPGIPADVRVLGYNSGGHRAAFVFSLALDAVFAEEERLSDIDIFRQFGRLSLYFGKRGKIFPFKSFIKFYFQHDHTPV